MGAVPFGRTNLLKATLLIVTGVLAACLVALVGTAEPVKAAFPGENGKIIFFSVRDGNEEIYAMDADGSGQTNLTNNPYGDYDPAFSPDSTRIAFTSLRDRNDEIYVMNADGTGQTNLTNNPVPDNDPAFSPDGARIAFTSLRDGNLDIYAMNADGSGLVRLTNDPARDLDPVFSPDGTRIAFTSGRDGNHEIYTMNADGSGPVNLTNNAAYDYAPAFSADGTRIAFNSSRDGNWEIYAMNTDGSGQTNLTNNPGSNDFQPAFSPDGTRIAFTSGRDGNHEIHTMNADGSGPVNLTNNAAYDANPDWQPLARTRYDFTGFYSPVDNPDVSTNKAKAGSSIPVKFSLGGDQGLDIFESGYPLSRQIPNPQETLDGVEQTVTAGASGLTYDPATGRYTYVWKTEKGWAGQYRQLVVKFDDGTTKEANFKFTR